ncbi:MAG: hypothetical protein WCK35_23790 [Chloroflexota bacterium]
MYEYMLLEMARVISTNCGTRLDETMNALSGYWRDKIAHVWQVVDVLEAARRIGQPMTREDAACLLKNIFDHHDSSQGITWAVLEAELADYHLDFAGLPPEQYPDVHGVFLVWREHDPIAHQFGISPHRTEGNLPAALQFAQKMAQEQPAQAVFLGCAPGLKADPTPWLTLLMQDEKLSITPKE